MAHGQRDRQTKERKKESREKRKHKSSGQYGIDFCLNRWTGKYIQYLKCPAVTRCKKTREQTLNSSDWLTVSTRVPGQQSTWSTLETV